MIDARNSMKIICFLPCTEIDWSMTASMVTTIATIVIGFVQFWQSWKMRKIEQENTEKEFRTNLFDKRYEIYSLFIDLNNICNQVFNMYNNWPKEADVQPEPREDFKAAVCSNYHNIEGVSAKKEYDLYFNKRDVIPDFDEKKCSALYQKSLFLNKKFFEETFNKLQMAKFCFSDDISKTVTEFSKILLKDIFVESNAEDWNQRENEEHFLDEEFVKKLNSFLEEIKTKKLIEKMEAEIKLNK